MAETVAVRQVEAALGGLEILGPTRYAWLGHVFDLPEYVRRLAAYLEERVTELRTAGIKDPLASLTLAALDITDELFRVREDKTRQDGDVDTRLGALVDILERLGPDTAPPKT